VHLAGARPSGGPLALEIRRARWQQIVHFSSTDKSGMRVAWRVASDDEPRVPVDASSGARTVLLRPPSGSPRAVRGCAFQWPSGSIAAPAALDGGELLCETTVRMLAAIGRSAKVAAALVEALDEERGGMRAGLSGVARDAVEMSGAGARKKTAVFDCLPSRVCRGCRNSYCKEL
jgi:hypothetical protein